MGERSTWLTSAAGTYKPRFVVYMRFINHALTNQITVFRVAVLYMYIDSVGAVFQSVIRLHGTYVDSTGALLTR